MPRKQQSPPQCPPTPPVETCRGAALRYASFCNTAGGAKVAWLLPALAFHFFNERILGG